MQALKSMWRSSAWIAILLACVLIAGQLFAMQAVFDGAVAHLLLPADAETQHNWLRLTASHMQAEILRVADQRREQIDQAFPKIASWFRQAPDATIFPTWPRDISWVCFSADGASRVAASPDSQLTANSLSAAVSALSGAPYFDQIPLSDGTTLLLYVRQQTLDGYLRQAAIDTIQAWPAEQVTLSIWLQRTASGTQESIAYQREIPAATPVVYGYQVPESSAPLVNALPNDNLAQLREHRNAFFPAIAEASAGTQACSAIVLADSDLALCVSARMLTPDILTHPNLSHFRALSSMIFYITLAVVALAVLGILCYQLHAYRKGVKSWQNAQSLLDMREQTVGEERRKIDKVYEELRRLGALKPYTGPRTAASVVHWLDDSFPAFSRITPDQVLAGSRATAIVLLTLDDTAEAAHAEIDSLAEQIVPIIQQHIRSNDMVARWHGASLMLVLNTITLKDALMRAEDVRISLCERAFQTKQGPTHITLTCGLSLMLQNDASWRQSVERAQRAQQRGKETGRSGRVYHEIL